MDVVLSSTIVSWYLASYGLAVASAVVPWLNAEVIVLAFAATARSPFDLAMLLLLATAGQVTGKAVMYWTGRRAASGPAVEASAWVARWRARLEGHARHAFAWVFVSGAVGVPPLYLVTMLAGAARLPFGRFLVVTSCGRLLHFAVLVVVPSVAREVAR